MQNNTDTWQSGNPYERFMGRWSCLIAQDFLNWMEIPHKSSWLDIGCGTGVLTKLILEHHRPKTLLAIDSSEKFISHAKKTINDTSIRFKVGLAESLDLKNNFLEAVVSGLVLNFITHPEIAVQEMIRVTKPGGKIGIFVWEYADGMEMLRYFWDAAVDLDHTAKAYDEGLRFPLCQEGNLESFVRAVGVKEVEARPIEVATIFQGFDDYWQPFLGNVGPAPAYVMGLDLKYREKLENKLREALPINPDESITLKARAWAIKGTV